MSKRFVFLEFLDPEVNSLVYGLRREFGGEVHNTNVHLTVRGPYSTKLTDKQMTAFKSLLGYEPILIHSVGMFDNKSCAVYLKVECEGLRKVWWKPDYPISDFGFNPHITLFESRDRKKAERIYQFLKSEQIAVVCHRYQLTQYLTKQLDFFPAEEAPRSKHFLQLSNRRVVRADILQRASNLIKDYEERSAE